MRKINSFINKSKIFSIVKWLLLFFVIIYVVNFIVFYIFFEYGYGSVSSIERLISKIPFVIYIFLILRKIMTGSKHLLWVLFIIIVLYTVLFIHHEKKREIERLDNKASAALSKFEIREEAKLLYDDVVGYSNVCEQLLAKGGKLYEAKEANNMHTYFCNDSKEEWAAGVLHLGGDENEMSCVDSGGTGTFGSDSVNPNSTKCL